MTPGSSSSTSGAPRQPLITPNWRSSPPWRRAITGVVLAATAAMGMGQSVRAETAEAASKPAVSISIFTSSRSDVCFDPGDIGAIRALATRERDRINEQGGIAGHRLDLRFFDDKRDVAKSIANMREALAEPTAVAMIGLSNSDRAKQVFEATGNEMKAKLIPFISAISVNSIFADHPNVFTMRPSQDDERLPVLSAFVERSGLRRVAFVGLKDTLFSTTLGDGLKAALGDKLVADHRLATMEDQLVPAEIDAAVADLKFKSVDIVFLGLGAGRNVGLIDALKRADFMPPLFLTGRIDSLPKDTSNTYPSKLYELAWDRLPELYNDRLLKSFALAAPEDWIFAGEKIAAAPGWSKGECTPRPESQAPNPLTDENLRAIGIGTQYADMLALIAASARLAEPDAGIEALRAHIVKQLGSTYASGRGVFQGSFENWSFLPQSRTATRTPFIVELPPGLGRTRLAPTQFAKLRNERLRSIDTLYLDIDLIRLLRVDDSEKSFFAEFYLSMREEGKGASIDLIEFANALIDPQTNDRQINVKTISDGGKSETYPDDVKIYQISGRFMFDPNLENYPFDAQRFAIEIRPKRGDAPFIVQPPPRDLRDQSVSADSWEPRLQFAGYDEDFVTSVDAKLHQQSVVPFYKASFVWLMTRETTDYYLRVVVPLAFILIVAYLSIFIPLSHFEAIVTIQVTALLSAVALYLSLPSIDADTATLSDRIFLFNYMTVSLMIGISIMRMNSLIVARPQIQRALGLAHVVAIPVMMGMMALYIHRINQAAG